MKGSPDSLGFQRDYLECNYPGHPSASQEQGRTLGGPSLHLGKVGKTKIILSWHQFPLCSLSKHFSHQIKNILCINLTGDLGCFLGAGASFSPCNNLVFLWYFSFLSVSDNFLCVLCIFYVAEEMLEELLCWEEAERAGAAPPERRHLRGASAMGTNPFSGMRGTNSNRGCSSWKWGKIPRFWV